MRVSVDQVEEIQAKEIVSLTNYVLLDNAQQLLQYCVKLSSYVFVGKIDEEIACVWGLVAPSFLSDQAYLWLLTTRLVDEHPFVFVRHSQMALEEMFKKYPIIVGHVLRENHSARKWLKWLGATFQETDSKGIPFVIRKKVDG